MSRFQRKLLQAGKEKRPALRCERGGARVHQSFVLLCQTLFWNMTSPQKDSNNEAFPIQVSTNSSLDSLMIMAGTGNKTASISSTTPVSSKLITQSITLSTDSRTNTNAAALRSLTTNYTSSTIQSGEFFTYCNFHKNFFRDQPGDDDDQEDGDEPG